MKYFGCPYCGNELQEEFNACCGEAGHGEMIEVDEPEEEISNEDN